MSHWQKIRDAARSLRREICTSSDLDDTLLHRAQNLLDSAEDHLNLVFIPEHPNSGNLRRALAVLEDDCIYFNNSLKPWYKAFCIAHEIGHFSLHHSSVHCTHDEIESLASEGESSAVEKLIGYGAGERREREANLFALEFLLPCSALKKAFLENNQTAIEIAEKVEMPVEVVSGQLARALLVPAANRDQADEASDQISSAEIKLDESQKRAATQAKCPALIAAGPGTGKTQTLTGRIANLINNGTDPKRILALTFSNKAAEEMRERIARIDREAAAQIKVLTFHAFGLDLMRSFWVEAGLETRSNLLDKIDALLYLENHLNFLDLEHYQILHDPTSNLAAILGAISRAKDELCPTGKYRALGEAMLREAQAIEHEEMKTKAEKVLETASVYDFYEKYLEKEKLLDFGDLIFRAVNLLRENENIRKEVRSRYDAILVDEFQDVNRACGMLLKEIAADGGANLWAVGDLRQSIYRWRGASPANINLFQQDFPNAELISLTKNYRSRTEIVEIFSHFAENMKAAGKEFFHSWDAVRDTVSDKDKTAITVEVADSVETEAANIAANIRQYREAGFRYKDCAIICRTHNQLNKFAAGLAAAGIPIFYLGELFERDEVRDLLALLDLKFSHDGHSLIRVAEFPEYRIPLTDARKIITKQKETRQTFVQILSDTDFFNQLSETAKNGANTLAKHLSYSPQSVSAWCFLANYLFADSQFLKSFFANDDVQNQSRRLAIYQFLRLAQTAEARFGAETEPIREFLNYVKKLAYFNEDKNYAQIPAEAENLDAVRLLTVHSAKGLEFPVVFLPYLGAGKIPAKKQGQTCPNPDGMIEGESDVHEEEEECLFFVAASRARDHLHLSRSLRYGESKSNESRFLTILKEFLPPAIDINSTEPETLGIEPENLNENEAPALHYSKDLDRYMGCPRDYFYTNILGLKGAGEKSIYLKFHSCVYDTLRSMQSMRQIDSIGLSEENAIQRLDEFWQAADVDAHPYSPVYKQKANEIVRRMCRKIENSNTEIVGPTYEVKISNARLRVRLDAVEIIEGDDGAKTAVIRKYKTGKSPKKIDPENADILMTVAVSENFADAKPILHRIYLSDDSVKEVPISSKVIKNRLEKYEKAATGIRERKFDPVPSDNNCPHCAHFFICPSGGKK